MRRGGEELLFDDPELAGMCAVAIHLVRGVVRGLPEEMLGSGSPWIGLAMAVGIRSHSLWQLAHAGLDLLGSMLIDERPFMGMQLFAPETLPGGDIVLHLQVGVPAGHVAELQPRLGFAFESMVREFVDPEAVEEIVVKPVGVSDGS